MHFIKWQCTRLTVRIKLIRQLYKLGSGLCKFKKDSKLYDCVHTCAKTYFQISDFYTYCSVIYVIYNRNIINMYVLSYHISIKIIFGVSITILSMKKLFYAYFMTHFVYTVKWHIGNVFNKTPRQNAPTDSVLTSVILKGIEWAFGKVYPTKIPGMVHQGLLAPQSLFCTRDKMPDQTRYLC